VRLRTVQAPSAGAAFIRAGSKLMMRRRSSSDIDDHRPISFNVRPQPRQSFDRGSIVQTLVQGVLIGGIVARG